MLKKSLRVPIGKFPRTARVLIKGKLFVVKISSNALRHSRVGVVVKKGGVRNSSKRNIIKRSVFRVFENRPEILNKPGTDYLVVVSGGRELDEAVNGELTKELESSIKELTNDN